MPATRPPSPAGSCWPRVKRATWTSWHHPSHTFCSPAQAILNIYISYVQTLKLKESTILVSFGEYSWIEGTSISMKMHFESERWAWRAGHLLQFCSGSLVHSCHPIYSGCQRLLMLSEKSEVGSWQCRELTFTFQRKIQFDPSLTNEPNLMVSEKTLCSSTIFSRTLQS